MLIHHRQSVAIASALSGSYTAKVTRGLRTAWKRGTGRCLKNGLQPREESKREAQYGSFGDHTVRGFITGH